MSKTSWYDKLIPEKVGRKPKSTVPEGVWTQCASCKITLYSKDLADNKMVCPKCDYHLRIAARTRIDYFLDPEERQELGRELSPKDFLGFRDSKRYKDRLQEVQKKLGEKDALIAVLGNLKGRPVVVTAFEYSFIGGSMGAVVGEKFTLAAEKCTELQIPLINFAASGGARMQEGLTSLMQMAKTSAALGKLKAAQVPFISVLTDPTMGGVSASLAMLGDINIAEPKALIGFAGPRVIQQTVRETLPKGFQSSEFLLEHGALDAVIHRHQLRDRISNILSLLMAAKEQH